MVSNDFIFWRIMANPMIHINVDKGKNIMFFNVYFEDSSKFPLFCLLKDDIDRIMLDKSAKLFDSKFESKANEVL
jgi:hypothetical protein